MSETHLYKIRPLRWKACRLGYETTGDYELEEYHIKQCDDGRWEWTTPFNTGGLADSLADAMQGAQDHHREMIERYLEEPTQ